MLSQQIRKCYYKAFGTNVLNNPMSPPSLERKKHMERKYFSKLVSPKMRLIIRWDKRFKQRKIDFIQMSDPYLLYFFYCVIMICKWIRPLVIVQTGFLESKNFIWFQLMLCFANFLSFVHNFLLLDTANFYFINFSSKHN